MWFDRDKRDVYKAYNKTGWLRTIRAKSDSEAIETLLNCERNVYQIKKYEVIIWTKGKRQETGIQ